MSFGDRQQLIRMGQPQFPPWLPGEVNLHRRYSVGKRSVPEHAQ